MKAPQYGRNNEYGMNTNFFQEGLYSLEKEIIYGKFRRNLVSIVNFRQNLVYMVNVVKIKPL